MYSRRLPLFLTALLLAALLAPAAGWGQETCRSTPTSLCLNQDRFEVEVSWRDATGSTGQGRVLGPRSEVSGLFALSSTQEQQMLVKVLNGCSINDRVWVFAATSSDVEHTLTVTDTLTGERRSYENPLGERPDALADTSAFTTCTAEDRRLPLVPGSSDTTSIQEMSHDLAPVAKQETGSCVPGPATLCLNDGRFRADVSWEASDDWAGTGKAVPGADGDSGLFWFFQQQNWETLVQILDRCDSNERFWVATAAATNVAYDLRITDTVTGVTETYSNPLGRLAPGVLDTDAFATCDAPVDTGATVRFVSDQSVMLAADRGEAVVEVEVVDAEGERIPDAEVSWTSSAPDLVSVEAQANGRAIVRSEGATTGFSEITARFGTSRAMGTVLLTVPAPETVLVDSAVVLARSGTDQAVLERTPRTESLAAGEILISGDRAGVIGRIESVQVEEDRVMVRLGHVTLPEAFERLEVRATGPTERRQVRVTTVGDTLVVRDGNGRLLTKRLLDQVDCEVGGRPAQIEIEGAEVNGNLDITAQIDLVIDFFSIEQFRAAVTGTLSLDGRTGSVQFDGSLAGEATCSLDLPQLELPGIPASVFTFSLTATPAVGVSAEASFDGPTLTITGPHASAQGVATGGIEYTSGGWRSVAETSWTGDAQLATAVDLETEHALEASTGPFVSLDTGVDVALGRGILEVELADFRFAELRGSAALSLEIASPLDPAEPEYTGPRWDLGLRNRGSLKFEVADSPLRKVLEYLDIPTRYDGEKELFDVEAPIDGSPRPELIQATSTMASCTGLPEARAGSENDIEFVVQGSPAIGSAVLWGGSASADSPLSELARGSYTPAVADGKAEISWQLPADATGTFRFYPRLEVDAVSEVAPYAGGGDLFEEVIIASGDGVPVIESIEPNPILLEPGGEREYEVRFSDDDAGVESITFELIEESGANCEIGRSAVDDVRTLIDGEIRRTANCDAGVTDARCVWLVRLEDCQGNISEPVRREVLCREGASSTRQTNAQAGEGHAIGTVTLGSGSR